MVKRHMPAVKYFVCSFVVIKLFFSPPTPPPSETMVLAWNVCMGRKGGGMCRERDQWRKLAMSQTAHTVAVVVVVVVVVLLCH